MAISKRCPACGKKLVENECVNPKCCRAALVKKEEQAKAEAEKAKQEQERIIEAEREKAKEEYLNQTVGA